jgi:phosphorylcholine metabolism protein LicD
LSHYPFCAAYKIFVFFFFAFIFDTKTDFRSMLELAQSLILNEEALNSLPENKRPVFIYEWLCFLNKVLVAAQKVN